LRFTKFLQPLVTVWRYFKNRYFIAANGLGYLTVERIKEIGHNNDYTDWFLNDDFNYIGLSASRPMNLELLKLFVIC